MFLDLKEKLKTLNWIVGLAFCVCKCLSVVHDMEFFFQADLKFLLYRVKSLASLYQHPLQVIFLVLLLEAPNVVAETRVVSVP